MNDQPTHVEQIAVTDEDVEAAALAHALHPDATDGSTITGPTRAALESYAARLAGRLGLVHAASPLPVHAGPWQAGDVARDADSDKAEDAWAYLPDHPGDPVPWRQLAGNVDWCDRGDLPANLALIVRGGQPVAP